MASADEQLSLSAFVPRLAVELGDDGDPVHTSVDGSMLSADISGFTALSEKLAGKGKAGAEEITELVNKCFTALIDAAYEFGGEVIKFGGDALLILFRGGAHATRAVDAGLAMQHALHSSSAAKRANLTMTVGVADGPFDVFVVGTGYREILITGPRATEVIRLEGGAAKGDTLVSASIASELPPSMLVREESGGWVVIGSTGLEPPGPASRHLADADLAPFVPAAVREQLAAFSGLGGEHRLVTVGFLMVTGVEAILSERGESGVAAAFHRLLDDVSSVCAAFGVTLLHTDIAPDGVKFVLCAGAPVNPGDTGDAMLQAALGIAGIDTPFVLRQGVQTGRVFAGFLGSVHRRTYTLMGDPVNTAARMLGKAGDREVVAVESVVRGTRTVFVTEPLEPFLVKGKTEPITAHKVRAASDSVRRDTSGARLVGRQHELDQLTSAIGELGEVVVLTGPAGVGKSRLLDAAWDRAEGIRIFQGACTPYGAASPYSVFRPLLRAGTGVDVNATSEAAGAYLTRLVEDVAPHLLPMLPLLAVPFGAEVPPTPEADAVDVQFRRSRIHDVVVDFLDAVLDGPVLVVVEDLHWVDSASGDLVSHLIRAAETRSWSGVLTRRPYGDWAPNEDSPNLRVISVEPLTTESVKVIAIESCERALSDAELDTITERADGNPLFAIELARAVSRHDASEALPDSIEGLISMRIDALPPAQRRLIRIASVFGQEFDLESVDAVATDDARIGPELDDMVEHRRDGRVRFRHAMYRDAAYEGLPFRRRQDLHGVVAKYLESSVDDPASVAALLSVHYSAAGEREPAWRYGRLAGDDAAAQYAQAEAAEAYRRALDAASRLRSIDPNDRRAVLQRLGDALLNLGDFDGAFDAFAGARRLSDPLEAVDLMRRQGQVRERQGHLSVAIRWFDRCLNQLGTTGGSRRAQEIRLQVWLAYAGTRHRQGRFDECLRFAEHASIEAAQLDDSAGLARANDSLHLASTYLGLDRADEYGARALALHQQLGDHLSQARIMDNMGIQAYFGYDWDKAVALYGAAADAGRVAGDVVEANLARNNAAEVWSDRGRFDLAESELDDVLRNWTAAGFVIGIATAASNLALVRTRRGGTDPTTTIDVLVAGLEQFRELEADEFILETTVRLAEASVHTRRVEAALAYVADAKALGPEPAVSARLDRQEAGAQLLAGSHERAQFLLAQSVHVAEEVGALYEVGLSGLLLGHVAGDGDTTAAARAVLTSLGVVDLPCGLVSAGCRLADGVAV